MCVYSLMYVVFDESEIANAIENKLRRQLCKKLLQLFEGISTPQLVQNVHFDCEIG